jgi:osmotically-inducible protein OsmY
MNKTIILAGIALIGALGCDYDRRTATTPTTSSPSVTSERPAMNESDRILAEKVQDALRRDAEVSSAAQGVQVYAKDGEVILQGAVGTQQDKAALESKAQQVAGVTRVSNQLTVTSASR